MYFDASEVEDDFLFLEGTQIDLVCVGAETTVPNSGQGEMLTLSFNVAGSEAKLWDRFVIKHPNPVVSNIAKKNLKKFCVAAGMPEGIKSLDDLKGVRVGVKLGINEYDGKKSNRIKEYLKVSNKTLPSPEKTQSIPSVSIDDAPF